MSIIRRKRETWTTIPNEILNDDRLSLDALGLLVYMLSKPDNWTFKQDVMGERFGKGRDAMRSIMRNLSAAGYVRRELSRDKKGHISTITIVSEIPEVGQPATAEPATDNPSVGQPVPLVKTETPVKTEEVKNPSCPAQVPDAPKAKKWGTDDDHKAARFIFGKVRLVDQTAKEPNWPAWANEIRLMREQDNRTHREICELFEWANQDQFWRANVLSPGKLRDKWTQLQAKRGSKAQPGKPSFDETQTRDYGESGLI